MIAKLARMRNCIDEDKYFRAMQSQHLQIIEAFTEETDNSGGF